MHSREEDAMCFGLGDSGTVNRRRDKHYEEDMYHSRPATPYNRDRSLVRAAYYRRDEFDRYSTVDNPRSSSYLTVPEEHRHHHRENYHEHHGHHHHREHEHSHHHHHHEHHGHGHHHHHSGREGEGERERIIYTATTSARSSATNLNGYGGGSRRDGYGSHYGESYIPPTLETETVRVSERELAPPGSYGHTERLVVPGYSRENSRHGHGHGEVAGREGQFVTTSTTAVSASARRGSATVLGPGF